jgi:hypothetical protein
VNNIGGSSNKSEESADKSGIGGGTDRQVDEGTEDREVQENGTEE